MMAGGRDCPHLPQVVLLLLALLRRGHAPFVTPSQASGTSAMRPRGAVNGAMTLPSSSFYDSFEDTVATILPKSVPPNNGSPCDYDVCRESQAPCLQLAASTGCLCPGVSLYNVPPEPPLLKGLSRDGSEVVVRWCAPYSYVTSYKLTVGGQERQEFGEGQRSGTLGRVNQEVEVCVVAVNDAGASKGSCVTYQPEDNGVSLRAGLIGGALGFLLLFSLAVLLWRHRVRRKTEARISTQEDPTNTPLENRDQNQTEA